ncbi:MAG: MTH938/NDUFAF3 family protein [Endomicrobiia bacterium]
MVKISHYEFGKIIINGKTYTTDIKIFNEKIISDWWRKEGHKLYKEDIKDILESEPEVLIIGCGANCVLEVSDELKEYLKQKNIKFYIANTYEAVKLFNNLYPNSPKKTALCVHLTC